MEEMGGRQGCGGCGVEHTNVARVQVSRWTDNKGKDLEYWLAGGAWSGTMVAAVVTVVF